jgi:hypothetical protein
MALRPAAWQEERAAKQRERLRERIEDLREGRAENEARSRDQLARHPKGSDLLDQIAREGRQIDMKLARSEVELAEMPVPANSARRELAAVERVIAERSELAILSARFDPPAYVTKELGERPGDSRGQKAWDRGVRRIEEYRHDNGITDPSRALGREITRGGGERARQQAALGRLRRAQRTLGREQGGRSLERGMSLGIGR